MWSGVCGHSLVGTNRMIDMFAESWGGLSHENGVGKSRHWLQTGASPEAISL